MLELLFKWIEISNLECVSYGLAVLDFAPYVGITSLLVILSTSQVYATLYPFASKFSFNLEAISGVKVLSFISHFLLWQAPESVPPCPGSIIISYV